MINEEFKVPNTANELVARIDSDKLEKVKPEIINELATLAYSLTKDATPFREGHASIKDTKLELVDGDEAIVSCFMGSKGPVVVISIIKEIKDKNDTIHVARKRYEIGKLFGEDEISLVCDLNSVINFASRDAIDSQLYDDGPSPEEEDMTYEEREELWEHRDRGTLLDEDTGINNVTNEEAINLLRLLSTSEQALPR